MGIGNPRHPDFLPTDSCVLPTLVGMTQQNPSSPSTPAGLDEATLAFADKVFDAARNGDAASLAQWLAAGLAPDLRNAQGDSLLMLASYHGHAEAAALLLEHGADAALANLRGLAPLAGAAFKGDVAMTELLLDHGAGVDSPSPDGRTPLMFAAMFNQLEIMRLLLARGANPGLRDAQGATALDCALAMGAQPAADLLREMTA